MTELDRVPRGARHFDDPDREGLPRVAAGKFGTRHAIADLKAQIK